MSVNSNDMVVGYDPTGQGSITGAQLATLVNSSYPQVDKGMTILTTDDQYGNPAVPDASTDNPTNHQFTKWQRYLWIRVTSTGVALYVWNPSVASAPTLLKWQTVNIAGIGQGTIVGGTSGMIAANTITPYNIQSVDSSQVNGITNFLQGINNIPAGDLAGSQYNSPVIVDGAVNTNKILDGNVTASKMGVKSVPVAALSPALSSGGANALAYQMTRVNAGVTAVEAFTPPTIFTGAAGLGIANSGNNSALAGNALKYLQVNSGATDFQFGAPPGAAIVASTRNLIMKTAAGNAIVSVSADQILLATNSGAYIAMSFTAGYTINFALSAAAALGPDTNVTYNTGKPSTGWYYIWAVSDGTNVSWVFSPSNSAPGVAGIGSLGSGYTYVALVGSAYWVNGVNLLNTFYQQDRTVYLDTGATVANTIPATINMTYTTSGVAQSLVDGGTSVTPATIISPLAKRLRVLMVDTTTPATLGTIYDNTIPTFGNATYWNGSAFTNTQPSGSIFEFPVVGNGNLRVKWAASTQTTFYTFMKYEI